MHVVHHQNIIDMSISVSYVWHMLCLGFVIFNVILSLVDIVAMKLIMIKVCVCVYMKYQH